METTYKWNLKLWWFKGKFDVEEADGEVEHQTSTTSLRSARKLEDRNPLVLEEPELIANQKKKTRASSKTTSTTFTYLAYEFSREALAEGSIKIDDMFVVVPEKGSSWMAPSRGYPHRLRRVKTKRALTITSEVHKESFSQLPEERRRNSLRRM